MDNLETIELKPLEVNLDLPDIKLNYLDIELNYINVDLKPIPVSLETIELPEDFLNIDLTNSLKDINLNNF